MFTRYKGKQPLTVGWASHEFGRIGKLLELHHRHVMHSLGRSFASGGSVIRAVPRPT